MGGLMGGGKPDNSAAMESLRIQREQTATAKKSAEEEKRKIIEDQERKEKERIAAEEAKKLAEELAEKKKQEEIAQAEKEKEIAREKLEKRKAYMNFLAKHEFVDDGTFKTITEGNVVTLYKKLGEFKNN